MQYETKAHIVVFIFVAVPFFGFFFGVNYPEILRTYYLPAEMNVTEGSIIPRYCCKLNCDFCGIADVTAPACDAMLSQARSLKPDLCSPNNTSSCPVAGPAAVCNNGYKCCAQCCSTCQSCSTSCSGSKSSSCSTSCTSYPCNCYCCQDTARDRCQMACDQCYSVAMKVAFFDQEKTKREAAHVEDFGTDLGAASSFFDAHRPNSVYVGYYKPDDPSVIIMSRDFTPWKWGVFSLFAAFMFADVLWITRTLLRQHLPDNRSADASANVLTSAMWIGTLWPIVILLPIQQFGYLTPGVSTALVVLMPIIAAFGWAPAIATVARRFRRHGENRRVVAGGETGGAQPFELVATTPARLDAATRPSLSSDEGDLPPPAYTKALLSETSKPISPSSPGLDLGFFSGSSTANDRYGLSGEASNREGTEQASPGIGTGFLTGSSTANDRYELSGEASNREGSEQASPGLDLGFFTGSSTANDRYGLSGESSNREGTEHASPR